MLCPECFSNADRVLDLDDRYYIVGAQKKSLLSKLWHTDSRLDTKVKDIWLSVRKQLRDTGE
jgi:hypothetical protein